MLLHALHSDSLCSHISLFLMPKRNTYHKLLFGNGFWWYQMKILHHYKRTLYGRYFRNDIECIVPVSYRFTAINTLHLSKHTFINFSWLNKQTYPWGKLQDALQQVTLYIKAKKSDYCVVSLQRSVICTLRMGETDDNDLDRDGLWYTARNCPCFVL